MSVRFVEEQRETHHKHRNLREALANDELMLLRDTILANTTLMSKMRWL